MTTKAAKGSRGGPGRGVPGRGVPGRGVPGRGVPGRGVPGRRESIGGRRPRRKSVYLLIRLSRDERERLHAAARSEGSELALWARRLMFAAAGIPLEDAVRPG